MDATWSAADLVFRDEVRTFLAQKLTPELCRAGSLMTSGYADHEAGMQWQRILHEKGWAAPAWPIEYGGCNWTMAQHYIFARERAAAGAPPISPMGIHMVAHALIRFGTPEQKAFFLPRMLTAEHFWCQGYSEPGSGSDLASLRMSAVADGNDFICSGTKIWTTHATEANWIFCLARTSQEPKPQQGITFLLIEMDTPGIEVRPLLMTSGEHLLNMVVFEQVRVPQSNVLGTVGAGWAVAKYLLEFERGGNAYAPDLRVRLGQLAEAAGRQALGDGALLDDPRFSAKLAAAMIRVDVLELLELRLLSALSHGSSIGASASMLKVLGSELGQHVTELALEAAGPAGSVYQPHAVMSAGPLPDYQPPGDGHVVGEPWQAIAPLRYLNDRAASIYAGSNEIQRSILAKAILSLK